jgi:hypothetical protein
MNRKMEALKAQWGMGCLLPRLRKRFKLNMLPDLYDGKRETYFPIREL